MELGSQDLVFAADNLTVLPSLPDGAFTLIYLDPPFNTGRVQVRRPMRTERSETGAGSASTASATRTSAAR